MLLANVFGRKDHLFARTLGDRHGGYSGYRLLRFEPLDDRLLFAVAAPSVPLNLDNGADTTTALPPTTTFVDLPADVTPASPANTALTAFPTPDLLFSAFPCIPIPVVVPDARGWVFEAGGGGFAPPPIDNAADNDFPVAMQNAPASGESFVIKPAIVSESALDTALAQFQPLAPRVASAEPSATQADARNLASTPDVFDVVLASTERFDQSSASPVEMSAAETPTLP